MTGSIKSALVDAEAKARERGVPSRRDDRAVIVSASGPTAFAVSLHATGEGFVVAFDGWHETFADADEALRCFAFGLSGECRLRVVRRGALACRWTLETRRDGAWIAHSEVGLLLVPFWRKPETVFLTAPVRSVVA